MSQAYRPSRYPCDVFRKEAQQSSKDSSENSMSDGKIGEENDPPKQRVRTLAKASRKELPKVKATWKSFLPTLSIEDVRRYRVPHHEAVTLELEESGYEYAADYLKMLFALDEEMRIKIGPGTVIWSNPRLIERDEFLDRLKIGLVKANKAILDEQRVAHATALIDMALYFEDTSWEWWWIGEQLFRSALTVSESIEDDDFQTLTTNKYFYGRFLLMKIKDVERSVLILEEAREASRGKNWNAAKMIAVKHGNLFKECSTLLYRATLSLARKAREYNVDIAVEACQRALRHAIDSDHDEYITDATCELGRSYLKAKQSKLALPVFIKYLNLSRKILDYEGICDAHMELAFAYKELGNSTNVIEHLELFRETASRFQLPLKLAKAHYLIGEHLLSLDRIAEATSHLDFAFTLYNGMGQTVEADQARCIAAVSRGQEIIGDYIEQVLRCGKRESRATVKLCEWKNSRVPFWREEIDGENIEGETDYEDTGFRRASESRSSTTTISETVTRSDIDTVRNSESTDGKVAPEVLEYHN